MDEKKSAWARYKEKIGDARPWDIINPQSDKVDKVVADERLEHCLGCEHLFAPTKQCRQCGCFMPLKVRLAEAECPIGKWGRHQVSG